MKLIMAINRIGVIGNQGELPWYSPDDFRHFKKMTMGGKLLVGRKTYETLPPLPGRELIVVGKGHHTLEEALSMAPDWVIGGKSIYEQTLGLCDEFHISIIKNISGGDTVFDLQKIWSSLYRPESDKSIYIKYFEEKKTQ